MQCINKLLSMHYSPNNAHVLKNNKYVLMYHQGKESKKRGKKWNL